MLLLAAGKDEGLGLMAGNRKTSNPDAFPMGVHFRAGATAVVEEARERVGEGVWVVTRSAGDALIVLCSAGETPHLDEGDTVILRGDHEISLPLELPDGSVFGAFCGLGLAHEQLAALPAQRSAAVLRALLAAEWRAVHAEREARTDALTGLPNRRAWDQLLTAEENRHQRYGGQSAIVVIDLDDLKLLNDSEGHHAGDALLRRAAGVLGEVVRGSDAVARTGGDEFSVLAVECQDDRLSVMVDRLRRSLDNAGVSASIGAAAQAGAVELAAVWTQADYAMYADKLARKP